MVGKDDLTIRQKFNQSFNQLRNQRTMAKHIYLFFLLHVTIKTTQDVIVSTIEKPLWVKLKCKSIINHFQFST